MHIHQGIYNIKPRSKIMHGTMIMTMAYRKHFKFTNHNAVIMRWQAMTFSYLKYVPSLPLIGKLSSRVGIRTYPFFRQYSSSDVRDHANIFPQHSSFLFHKKNTLPFFPFLFLFDKSMNTVWIHYAEDKSGYWKQPFCIFVTTVGVYSTGGLVDSTTVLWILSPVSWRDHSTLTGRYISIIYIYHGIFHSSMHVSSQHLSIWDMTTTLHCVRYIFHLPSIYRRFFLSTTLA